MQIAWGFKIGFLDYMELALAGFFVLADGFCADRACLITKDALQELSRLKAKDSPQASMMDVFLAFEATITGVARRLVFAKVPGTPLTLGANTFASLPHAG